MRALRTAREAHGAGSWVLQAFQASNGSCSDRGGTSDESHVQVTKLWLSGLQQLHPELFQGNESAQDIWTKWISIIRLACYYDNESEPFDLDWFCMAARGSSPEAFKALVASTCRTNEKPTDPMAIDVPSNQLKTKFQFGNFDEECAEEEV